MTSIEKGKTDTFYYSSRNYQRSSGDRGKHYWAWSSSVLPSDDGGTRSFNGNIGHIGAGYRYNRGYYHAAPCVVGGAGVK